MVDVPQSQARRVMRSSVALNVSDGVDSPDTNHHAIVEDSLNEDLFEIPSDSESIAIADEQHRPPTKGKLKSTKAQPSLSADHHETQKDSAAPGKLATAHASLANLEGTPVIVEEHEEEGDDEDILSPSEDEPAGPEDIDEYQPPTKKVKVAPRSNQTHAKAKPAPVKKSKPKAKGKQNAKQNAKQKAKPQQPKMRKSKTANADRDDKSRSKESSPVSAPQPARRSALNHMQAQSDKPKLPLVDEEVTKKAAIIAFDEHGPLNQGRSSLPPSATSKRVGDTPVPASAIKRKKHSESIVVSAKPLFVALSQEDGDSDPLGGYAKHMPDRAWKDKPQHLEDQSLHTQEPAMQITDVLAVAAALSSDHADAQLDELPQLPDRSDLLQAGAMRTVSQLAMPPPDRPTGKIKEHVVMVPVAVMQPRTDTPASEASTEVPEDVNSPINDTVEQETDAVVAKHTTTDKQTCADDSGYHSTVQPAGKTKKAKRAPSSKSNVHIDKRGSPSIAPVRAVLKDITGTKLNEAIPQSSKIFHNGAAVSDPDGLQDFAEKLPRDYANVFPSDRTTIPSRDESNPSSDDAAMHEVNESSRQDDLVDEILHWRESLSEHHIAMFDSLLVDAYHVVSQVARREHLVQGRINSYRNKGQKLVEDLAQTYEREVKNLRGANKH